MTNQENSVVASVLISLLENGIISVDAPEGMQSLGYEETEELVRKAHQRMVENRIISNSITAILKAQEVSQNASN